jgi:hypothetical protein
MDMARSPGLLPDGFEDLEPFAQTWGQLDSTEARYARRVASPMEDLRAVYAAVQPRIVDIFAHIDAFDQHAVLPPAELRLYRIALSLIEVAMAVEVFSQPMVPYDLPPKAIKAQWTSEA